MSITGFPDSPPAKVSVPITDISAGLLAANGILCAYIHALKTGQGQMADTSLLEAGIAYTIWESSSYFASDEVPGPLGSAHRVNAPYQVLRTKDGYINIGAATQSTWERFCRATGLASLIDDERFLAPSDAKSERSCWPTSWKRPSVSKPRTTGSDCWIRPECWLVRSTVWPRCIGTLTLRSVICWLTWKTRNWAYCTILASRSSCRRLRARSGGVHLAWANTLERSCASTDCPLRKWQR